GRAGSPGAVSASPGGSAHSHVACYFAGTASIQPVHDAIYPRDAKDHVLDYSPRTAVEALSDGPFKPKDTLGHL
ncbi:TPA: hypothetical protein ACH3X2_000925, partial [Trebouxia sp. C0005]